MQTRVVSAFQKLKLEQIVYNSTKDYFLQQVARAVSRKRVSYAAIRSKLSGKILNSAAGRRRVLHNYVRYGGFVPHRQSVGKLSGLSHLFPGKFIDKGCSAAIVAVANKEYDGKNRKKSTILQRHQEDAEPNRHIPCNLIRQEHNESKFILKQPYTYYPGGSYENESGILAKLSAHPNIIQYAGEFLTDICQDPIFFTSCPDVEHYGVTKSVVLERMEMNLENLLKDQELSTIDRIDILSQILEAQVYLRRKSICHRDLKTSNILVKKAISNSILKYPLRFIIKVADFDCAVDLKALSSGKKVFHQGTFLCTAPEILKSSSDPSVNFRKLYAKSDIWAIGTIAYEIFQNENPFIKVTSQDYCLDDLPPIEAAPNVVQKLVRCLLDPDPNFRYQSCIASDILQLFRMKTILSEDVFKLFKSMALEVVIGCSYVHQMYLSVPRFIVNPKRLEFAMNFINE